MVVSGQLHATTALPRYSLEWSFGRPQSRSGRYGEEKNIALAGNRTPAVHPVAQSLYRLQSNGKLRK
jgi:hypothetical protein